MKQPHWILLALVFCGMTQAGQAADSPVIERKITKEPAYLTSSPGYALLVFGKEGSDRVWMVHDGDVLYVDRNGNGDLTEPGERIERQKPRKGFEDSTVKNFEVGEVKVGGLTHKGLSVSAVPLKEYSTGGLARRPDFQGTIKKYAESQVYRMTCDVEVPGIKGGGLGGRLSVLVGLTDVEGFLLFGEKAQKAPLIRMGGPIHIQFSETKPRMRKSTPTEMMVSIGFPGQGPGTFAAIGYEDTLPPKAKPVIEVEVLSSNSGIHGYRENYELPNRCDKVNFYGPVRVEPKVVYDKIAMTLSVPAWKEGQVVSRRLELALGQEQPNLPILPVASELIWTIRHPDLGASIFQMRYSTDGKRLFFSGFPLGAVQIWDLENKKEIRRIESPKGYPVSTENAQLTPDWKTLYLCENINKLKIIEEMGKRDVVIEYNGRVQVWDVETGEFKKFLHPATGSGNGFGELTPDGKKLVWVEMKYARGAPVNPDSFAQTSLWDLKTGEGRLIGDSFMAPSFSRDSRFGFFSIANDKKKMPAVQKIDLETLEVIAEFECSGNQRPLSIPTVSSPDDQWLVARLAAIRGLPPTTLFLDPRTLKEEARLLMPATPKGEGWEAGSFSPDGKIYETSDEKGNIHLWSLAEKKVKRIIPMENRSGVRSFRPDGKFLAVAWRPKYDDSLQADQEPDPMDLPQPRITLIDLSDPKVPPKTLIAPQGKIGPLQFRPDGKQLSFGSSGAVHLFDVDKLLSPK